MTRIVGEFKIQVHRDVLLNAICLQFQALMFKGLTVQEKVCKKTALFDQKYIQKMCIFGSLKNTIQLNIRGTSLKKSLLVCATDLNGSYAKVVLLIS